MKTRYTFSSGDTIEATPEELQTLRAQYETYLQNYLELYSSMEDDDYVARGNGFCDSKFSESFLDAQIEKYRGKIKEMDQWLKNQ
ncbi:MAG: hypothetical protein J6T86_08575 [Bacteroidales bacterium]|nr:hypothetical protein [Bacteroidales bacterium]